MSYGRNPWLQTQWDARAATNFMAGGSGAGLLTVGALAQAAGASTALWVACVGVGLALVGAGLTAVWFEIGRPWRAVNVIRNPRTSWMSRESMIAPLLFAAALALWLTRSGFVAAALALCALAFVFAQGRLLHAAKGVPAWHDPSIPAWIVATALVEGTGLALAIAAVLGEAAGWTGLSVAALTFVRALAWGAYRRRVAASIAPGARRALDVAGVGLVVVGTLSPLLLALAGALLEGRFALAADASLFAVGILAWLGGWLAKFGLVCRASYNRGFVLPHVPIRDRR
jgi:phenylacetyl-CoA:acceptor oxidoreductase subunit 2